VNVRVLFVEDSESDVELQLRRLRDASVVPQWERVQSESALRASLAEATWDAALVDYNIPGFSGLEALRLIAELAPDLPSITVSGSIDEDTAVATISAGAVDYVLKDNLTRLAPAVRHAVDGVVMRRAHRRAAESARLALYAVDNASLAILSIVSDGTIVYANEFAAAAFGMDRGALPGVKIWDVDEGSGPERWPRAWAELVEKGVVEFRIDRCDAQGRRLVLDVTTNYLEGADRVISYGRDVTARVEAEEEVRESESRYRRMIELAGEGIWMADEEERTSFVNDQMARMLGVTPAEMAGRPVTAFMFEEDLDDHRRRMRERRGGRRGDYERRFRRRDDTEVWTIVSSVAVHDDDGGFAGSFGMFTDITERRQAEEALRAERSNLAAIFEASPVAMLVLDEDLNVVRVNRAALTLASDGAEDLLDHDSASVLQCGDALACVHCGDDPRGCGYSPDCAFCPLRRGVEAVLQSGTGLRGVELALEVRHDGGSRTVWLRMGAERMRMNERPHVTVALDDITGRRVAEDALRESEERFKRFAERIPGFVSMKDEQHRYVFLSDNDETHAVVHAPEWSGRTPTEVWGSGVADRVDAVADAVLAGDVVDEVIRRGGDEAARYYRELHFPVPREGVPPLVGGLSLDVTDQVVAEEEVRRTAEQLRRTVEGAVLAMSHVVETRDPYTAGHERRVSELAVAIGRELELPGDVLDGLRLAALIHDIGKVAVPAEILAKPGRLSVVEFNLIKQHSQAGYEILEAIDFGRPVAEIVLQHHERLDGTGYPRGLDGAEILLEARILSVADVVEAMSSHRPYRAALGMGAALDEIREGAGTRYDADVAAACVTVVKEKGFLFTP